MTWIDPGPEPPPPTDLEHLLDDETRTRLDELLAAEAAPPITWAVPGVTGLEGKPPAPSSEVAAFSSAVVQLEQVDPTLLTPDQALADLKELMRSEQVLRLARLARMTDAETRRLATMENQPSLMSWVRRHFPDVRRDDVPLAGRLRPYVHLRLHVKERAVTVEAASLVGRALDKLRRHVDRPDGLIDGLPSDEVVAAVVDNVGPLVAAARMGLEDDDPLLIELLTTVSQINRSSGTDLEKLEIAFTLMGRLIPQQLLGRALEEQVDAVLPNLLELRGEKGYDTRSMRIDRSRAYGGGRITVDADDELMELADTVIAGAARLDPANPDDTEAKRQIRENPELSENDVENDSDVRFPRTRGQRLHDAFKLILHQHLAAGLGGSYDKAPVAVSVVVSQKALEGAPGALPATSAGGRRIPRHLLRRWWCDASITALVVSQGLIPLGLTHEQRTLTARERKASKVQHGGVCDGIRCCSPHDPLTVLVPHHVRSWAKFGKTSMTETVWLCPRLHDAVHRGKTVPLRNGRWLNQHGWTEEPLLVDF